MLSPWSFDLSPWINTSCWRGVHSPFIVGRKLCSKPADRILEPAMLCQKCVCYPGQLLKRKHFLGHRNASEAVFTVTPQLCEERLVQHDERAAKRGWPFIVAWRSTSNGTPGVCNRDTEPRQHSSVGASASLREHPSAGLWLCADCACCGRGLAGLQADPGRSQCTRAEVQADTPGTAQPLWTRDCSTTHAWRLRRLCI